VTASVREEYRVTAQAHVPSGPEPVPHEQVRKYLASAPQGDTWRSGDLAELRAETRRVALEVRGELAPVSRVEAVPIAGRRCRLYVPEPHRTTGPDAAIGWVHGGGWVHGDLDSYDGVARAMAIATGLPVLSVDYRLAPEHPFPAGLDDVWSCFEWLSARFRRVVLAGDSSGGNMVAAAALKARDLGEPLAGQVLIYPVLDSGDTEYKIAFRDRYARFAGQPGFGPDSYERIRRIWQQYVPDATVRTDPYATPSAAASLAGVAPTVMITAEHDILRGECEAYAARLRADGVPVTLHTFPGQIHGFFQMRGVMSDAQHAMDLVASAVTDLTSTSPSGSAPQA
jgi:acetyl esterase